jgi:hypothetical protein
MDVPLQPRLQSRIAVSDRTNPRACASIIPTITVRGVPRRGQSLPKADILVPSAARHPGVLRTP